MDFRARTPQEFIERIEFEAARVIASGLHYPLVLYVGFSGSYLPLSIIRDATDDRGIAIGILRTALVMAGVDHVLLIEEIENGDPDRNAESTQSLIVISETRDGRRESREIPIKGKSLDRRLLLERGQALSDGNRWAGIKWLALPEFDDPGVQAEIEITGKFLGNHLSRVAAAGADQWLKTGAVDADRTLN